MPARVRPTSPHLQIYRWQISNSLSILHRITGAFLGLGLIALSFWWVSLAGGAQSYAAAANIFGNPLGLLVLIGWTFAFCFHLLNGIRHLFWDAGRGFERTARQAGGWFAVAGAAVLTVSTWIWIWLHLS
jgi:succinate dehydrogenase / fumarate reductase cytochrome b subunit